MTAAPKTLNAADIDALIDRIDTRGVLERMFRALADGQAVQPPQTVSLFPGNGGDFITYLGVMAEEKVFGAKLSPYIPGTGGNKALVTAWTLLMSMESGEPILLCDSLRLTTERTAATSVIAADRLAPKGAKILTIIGTGAAGLAHLRHAQSIRDWTEVRLCSPSAAGKAGLPTETAKGVPVQIGTDPDAAAAGADVVMLCTSAGQPVIDVTALKPGAVVTSISTNVPNAHEVDPAALVGLDVYCDYRETTPSAAGEMKLAAAAGTWSADAVRGDLPGLVAGRADAPQGDRPVFFRSIGLGLEDVAAALAVFQGLQD